MNRGRQPKHRFKCASHVAQLSSARLLSLWTDLWPKTEHGKGLASVMFQEPRAAVRSPRHALPKPTMVLRSRRIENGCAGTRHLHEWAVSSCCSCLQRLIQHNSPIPTENVFYCAAQTRHCVGSRRIARGIGHRETMFWLDLLRQPRTIASQLFVSGSIQPRTMLQTPQPMRKAPT